MIPNAITLHDFESRMKTEKRNQDQRIVVVTYCTIGYRSGLEARRLRDRYHLNVLNLDGIVSYTHACSTSTSTSTSTSSQNDQAYLIDPKTGKATKRVHVFGPAWNVASDQFEATYFSKPSMAWRGFCVGCNAFVQIVKGFFGRCYSRPFVESRDLAFEKREVKRLEP